MKIASVASFCLSFVFLCFLKNCSAKLKRTVYCGACIAMIDEMNWEISKIDPKKTIQAGSFRIMPDGNQDLQEIPLARSAGQLTDLLEEVCNQMNQYGLSTNEEGRQSYVKTSSRDGSPVSLNNLQMSGEIQNQLQFACESLVEDHEEELVPAFQVGLEKMAETICVDLLNLCTVRNITDHELSTESVLSRDATKEKDDEDEDEEEEDDDGNENQTKDEL